MSHSIAALFTVTDTTDTRRPAFAFSSVEEVEISAAWITLHGPFIVCESAMTRHYGSAATPDVVRFWDRTEERAAEFAVDASIAGRLDFPNDGQWTVTVSPLTYA